MLCAILMITKIPNCLSNRTFSQPILTNSSQSVSKILQIFPLLTILSSYRIKSLAMTFMVLFIDSYPSKPQKSLCGTHRTKNRNCLANRPFSRPFLTNSSPLFILIPTQVTAFCGNSYSIKNQHESIFYVTF